MSNTFITTSAVLLFLQPLALAQELVLDGFELWQETAPVSVLGTQSETPPAAKIARASVESRVSSKARAPVSQIEEPIVQFGAGASFAVPMGLSEQSGLPKFFSEFSANWAPRGAMAAVGADLAIGRDNSFIFRPNLKFYVVTQNALSVYLEGACGVYALDSLTEVGGGAGLGIVVGLMDHLALELRATGMAFSLSPQVAATFFKGDPRSSDSENSVILFAGFAARLMAKF